MKNLILLFFLFPFVLQSQSGCPGGFTEYYLNSNNIKAAFHPRGSKFTTWGKGEFLVPYPSKKKLSTIFASTVWVGGFDNAGNYRRSIEKYPKPGEYDFSVGPLNSIGIPYDDTICMNFDTAWNVFAEDIYRHMTDYEEDFIINDTIPSIFGWPARGNKFFKQFNGFLQPDNLDFYRWAPFRDNNSNGVYDPDQGDYPELSPTSPGVIIPDQMMWMVFNDLDTNYTSGNLPLRLEFQLLAYAFHCEDNEILNNTIFNKYRIVSRATTRADSVFFGMWTDFDLGCSADDYIGSDSLRSTAFVYNEDPLDGDSQNDCSSGGDTYEGVPPVQSMTWLSHPMHAFSGEEHSADIPLEEYNILNGRWGDGTQIRPAGDGYNQSDSLAPTRYFFNGDPRDTSSWAAINVMDDPRDYKYVSSISLGRIDPGTVKDVVIAYMYHHDPDSDHLGQISKMQENIDSLFRIPFWSQPCVSTPLCLDDSCVWPGDFDKNGIVDQRDYLMWGVFNDQTGPVRNGQISWRGHPGEEWNSAFADINAKHGDADGSGVVDLEDIDIHRLNNLQTNRYYTGENFYPVGSDIELTALPFFDEQGRVEEINVKTSRAIENVHGLTFEIEFDTSLFEINKLFIRGISDTSRLFYGEVYDPSSFYRFAFVKKDHSTLQLNSGTSFFLPISDYIVLKPGLPIPNCTVIRLRNLKAIDADGNDLQLGSVPLVVCKEGYVGIEDPLIAKTKVYPNPSTGKLYIESEIPTEAQLFSIDGQLIRHFKASELNTSIDISSFHPGLYILRMMATGESIKIVLQ